MRLLASLLNQTNQLDSTNNRVFYNETTNRRKSKPSSFYFSSALSPLRLFAHPSSLKHNLSRVTRTSKPLSSIFNSKRKNYHKQILHLNHTETLPSSPLRLSYKRSITCLNLPRRLSTVIQKPLLAGTRGKSGTPSPTSLLTSAACTLASSLDSATQPRIRSIIPWPRLLK